MAPLLIITLTALTVGCSKEFSGTGKPVKPDEYNLALDFKPSVDSLRLKLDSVYTNIWGENYSVSAFKFYISKIDLINTDSNKIYSINAENYFLVDAADSTTWTVKLKSAPFRYNKVAFIVGVDSLRNVSGAQTGDLDPAKGMFWTWNSGYIMAKLEGKSSSSTAANNKFEYHIGGFSGPDNVLRKTVLLFPFGEYSEVLPGSSSVITIKANVNAWFYNPHDLKIEDKPVVTTPGPEAKAVSENYSKMFTVTEISN
ncbi:MAG: hypothetical protein H7Y27_10475 [Gemmatimonadaceae bacterium]|nr:hypothetical protein [Chitinophagaceae bacterium]